MVTTANPSSPFLAFDTSGPTARVAIIVGGTIGAAHCLEKGERVSDRHSGTLLPLCHELLGRAGLAVTGLSAVACGSGPGSFTGLRVGLSVAKGLALACDLPLVLVPSLAALACDLATTPGDELLAPCIDAGKGEVYVQLFRRPAAAGGAGAPPDTSLGDPPAPVAITPELRVTPAAFANQLLAEGRAALWGGTGVDRHRAVLEGIVGVAAVRADFPGPSALAIGRLAGARLARGERDDLDAAVPVYGRPPDITAPKRPAVPRG